jgi:hypothetical protein
MPDYSAEERYCLSNMSFQRIEADVLLVSHGKRKGDGDILKVAHEAVFFSLCKVIRPRQSFLHLIARPRPSA